METILDVKKAVKKLSPKTVFLEIPSEIFWKNMEKYKTIADNNSAIIITDTSFLPPFTRKALSGREGISIDLIKGKTVISLNIEENKEMRSYQKKVEDIVNFCIGKNTEKLCHICDESGIYGYICGICSNKTCEKCLECLTKTECPYCRTYISIPLI